MSLLPPCLIVCLAAQGIRPLRTGTMRHSCLFTLNLAWCTGQDKALWYLLLGRKKKKGYREKNGGKEWNERDTERDQADRGREGGEKKKVGLSTKIGIKPLSTALRHLENSSGKQGLTLRATCILKNCPHSQQIVICYLLYKSSPVSTTISLGSVHGILSKSYQHLEEEG